MLTYPPATNYDTLLIINIFRLWHSFSQHVLLYILYHIDVNSTSTYLFAIMPYGTQIPENSVVPITINDAKINKTKRNLSRLPTSHSQPYVKKKVIFYYQK